MITQCPRCEALLHLNEYTDKSYELICQKVTHLLRTLKVEE